MYESPKVILPLHVYVFSLAPSRSGQCIMRVLELVLTDAGLSPS